MTSTTVSCPAAGLSPASQQRAWQLVALLAGGSRWAGSNLQGRELLEAVARLESGPSLNQSLTDQHMTTGLSWSLCLQRSICLIKTTSHSSSFNSLSWLQGALHNTFFFIIVLLSHIILWKWHQAITILESGRYPQKMNNLFSQHYKSCSTVVLIPAKKKKLHFWYVYTHIM